MDEFLYIITSVPEKKLAVRISDRIVEKGLAMCAQVYGPVESVFYWNGKRERRREWICSAKAEASLYSEVEKEIRKMHPDKVPEIISFRIKMGLPEYMEWLSLANGQRRANDIHNRRDVKK